MDFCTASIALNHWTFGLPLDYLWTTFLNLLVLILWSKMTRTRDTMGHPKALTKTSGTCSLESHLTKAKLSFSSSSNYLIHLDSISAFVSQILRDLRVLEIPGYQIWCHHGFKGGLHHCKTPIHFTSWIAFAVSLALSTLNLWNVVILDFSRNFW